MFLPHSLILLIRDYFDYTNYMSGVVMGHHDMERGPLTCYNSAAHITLGWFDDSTLEIADINNSPLTSSGPIRLAAFVDYTEVVGRAGWHVIVRINTYFSFQYNRAKKHNIGMYEEPNRVHLVTDQSADATYVLADLRPCNSSDVGTAACVYDSPEMGRIEICGFEQDGEIDYAIVSISTYNGPSFCGSEPVASGGGGISSSEQPRTQDDSGTSELASSAPVEPVFNTASLTPPTPSPKLATPVPFKLSPPPTVNRGILPEAESIAPTLPTVVSQEAFSNSLSPPPTMPRQEPKASPSNWRSVWTPAPTDALDSTFDPTSLPTLSNEQFSTLVPSPAPQNNGAVVPASKSLVPSPAPQRNGGVLPAPKSTEGATWPPTPSPIGFSPPPISPKTDRGAPPGPTTSDPSPPRSRPSPSVLPFDNNGGATSYSNGPLIVKCKGPSEDIFAWLNQITRILNGDDIACSET
jgi:hypothetical protein